MTTFFILEVMFSRFQEIIQIQCKTTQRYAQSLVSKLSSQYCTSINNIQEATKHCVRDCMRKKTVHRIIS